ncbi:hypothetical protein TrLO_g7931 [Triparma laevis f. longispina]|uniref:RING-type domain-containing protein n=1 Tax=Triparma laevis f. longispina TaxID=1714387 RepID=A0A9W7FJP9_9STRA|nr:hypothetical protein TrLO_g7931 [Triparma laevis f. longispina]
MGNCQNSSANNGNTNGLYDESRPPADVTDYCPICLEKRTLTFQYTPESNEHFISTPCTHRFCPKCLAQYVGFKCSSTAEWEIKCPIPECAYKLSNLDVRRLTSQENHRMWSERRNGSHLNRFLQNDPTMLRLMNVKTEITWFREREAERVFEEKERNSKSLKEGLYNKSFQHGTRVTATYLSNVGRRYQGTIVEINNNLASIAYDDGDFWGTCPISVLRYIEDDGDDDVARVSGDRENRRLAEMARRRREIQINSRLKIEDVTIGLRVHAGWKSGNEFYAGTVRSVDKKNKTVEINYNDGDYWNACPIARVRDLSSQTETKCCPQCYVIIQKAEGCDSMMCVCGCYFGWNGLQPVSDEVLRELVKKEDEEGIKYGEEEEEEEGDDDDDDNEFMSAAEMEKIPPAPAGPPPLLITQNGSDPDELLEFYDSQNSTPPPPPYSQLKTPFSPINSSKSTKSPNVGGYERKSILDMIDEPRVGDKENILEIPQSLRSIFGM